jgi:ADP-ribose pyrophosphatase
MNVNVLAQGNFLSLVKHRNGWEWVERINSAGVVGIAALTPKLEIILVEQFRQPISSNVIELPAGLVELSEKFELAAARELWEETGYQSKGNFKYLATVPSSSGLTSEITAIYLTTGVTKDPIWNPRGTEEQGIKVHVVSLKDIDKFLGKHQRSGTFVDPRVFTALYKLAS